MMGQKLCLTLILCQIMLMSVKAHDSHDKCECGTRKYKAGDDELVINGNTVQSMAKYPWLVTLHYKLHTGSAWGHCGGALISETFVVTAGHCVMSSAAPLSCLTNISGRNCIMHPKDLKVGVMSKNKREPGSHVSVKSIIVHPQYKKQTSKNDIALVQLSSPVKCSKYRIPICVAETDFVKDGERMHIAGWGRTSGTHMEAPKTLREGVVKKVSSKHCARPGLEPKELFCTVGTHFSSCQGDSGTSVFKKKNDQYFTLGITSTHSSVPRCSPTSPVTFTSIPAYYKFIKEHVKDLPSPKNKD